MIYKEAQQDLFSVSPDYYLVHCISADFKMGAGIAKKFAEMGTRDWLFDLYNDKPYPWKGKGDCVYTWAAKAKGKYKGVFHLITKRMYYEKPTYVTLRQALESLKESCAPNFHDVKKIAMPKIGCGLNRLDWDKVKPIIQKVFADTDIEILVCYL